MNKKGFTLIELLATIVLISIIMSIVMVSATKISRDNKLRIYHEYENMMVEYARINELNTGDLIDLFDLEELEKVKRECIGYVSIDHTKTPWEYKAYISCPDDYETEGFDSTKAVKRYNGGNADGPIFKILFVNNAFITDYNIYQQIIANGTYEYTPIKGETIPYHVSLSAGVTEGNAAGFPFTYTGDKEMFCDVNADEPNGDEHGKSEYVKCYIPYSPYEDKELVVYAADGIPETGEVHIFASDDGVSDFDIRFTYEVVKQDPSINVSNDYIIDHNLADSSYTINFYATTDKGLSLSVNNNKCTVTQGNNGYNNTISCRNISRGNTTLTFTTAETRKYKAGSVTKTFNLPFEDGYVNVTGSNNNVPCNGTKTYTVSHHGGTLSCTTSDSSVATCSVSGNNVIVTGISNNSFKLTITSSATSIYSSASKEINDDVGKCTSWHYNSSIAFCSVLCNSQCSDLGSSTWSCIDSDTNSPSSSSQTTGSHCWCYY